MSTVNNSTDKVLVQRSGTTYQTSADMSSVNSSDLIIVNRSGTDYKCTFADWQTSQLQEPAIQSLTVAATAGAARFSSKSFTVSWAMDDNGNPGSTKAFKVSILKPDNGEGNFPQLDYLMKFSTISSTSISGTTVTINLSGSTNISRLRVGDTVRPLNAVLSRDYYATDTFGGNNPASVWAGFFDGNGAGGGQPWWYPSPGIPFSSSLTLDGGESGYDRKRGVGPNWDTGYFMSNGGNQTLYSGANTLTGLSFDDYRGATTGGSIGKLYVDGNVLRRNIWDPSGVVTAISGNTVTITNGDNNEGSTLTKWSSVNGQVLCRDYNISNAKRPATEIFNKGSFQVPRVASKLFGVLGANGTVSDFNGDDPGWVTLTDQTSPATITLPANATFSTCDDDFPVGSRIVVEMRATNSEGTAYITSNILTP